MKATARLAVDVIATCFGQTREGAHFVFNDLPTPSSPDESDSEEEVRMQESSSPLWKKLHAGHYNGDLQMDTLCSEVFTSFGDNMPTCCQIIL